MVNSSDREVGHGEYVESELKNFIGKRDGQRRREEGQRRINSLEAALGESAAS
jgi:hypothetical protein